MILREVGRTTLHCLILLGIFLVPVLLSIRFRPLSPRLLAEWNIKQSAARLRHFSPDGKDIITATDHGRWGQGSPYGVWDVETGRKRFEIANDFSGAWQITFSPDG